MTRPHPSPVDLDVDLVVPTIGRPSLEVLLRSLGACGGSPVRRVLLVDDRRDRREPLLSTGRRADDADGAHPVWRETWLAGRVKVITGRASGPAAARNDGWRAASASWVAFLDDDVVVPPTWLEQLAVDLRDAEAGEHVGGSQGRIEVPVGDRPTDWERNVQGLERATWATADMAYRRVVLAAVSGFDERFPRAYREDADLGLRVVRSGWSIARGGRHVVHPVPPAAWSVSLIKQAGNADDPLMDRLHGRAWRSWADAPPGRRPLHLATVGAAIAAAVARSLGLRRAAGVAAVLWGALTAQFIGTRLRHGSRARREVFSVVATSVLIPPAAVVHWCRGWWRARTVAPGAEPPAIEAVLFDRDGTLVEDVPYNGDPDRVRPVPGAVEALDRLRSAGLRLGIVSNQSGIERGLLGHDQVEAVNDRVVELLGPFDHVAYCPHGPDDGCACRKPAAGMVLEAAAGLRVAPQHIAVIGDIGADVRAARAGGALGLLVPTEVTRIEEVEEAELVFAHLGAAVDHLLGEAPR